MQMHAHVPQKGFRLLEDAIFLAGEDAMLDQVGGVVDMIEIFADPIERLQIAQPALAFLHIGLDQIAALALAAVAHLALGQLGFHEIAAIAGGDFGPEFLAQIVIQARGRPTDSALPARRCGW